MCVCLCVDVNLARILAEFVACNVHMLEPLVLLQQRTVDKNREEDSF